MGELCTRIGYDHSTVTGLTDEPDFIKNMQTRWPYCIACVGQRNRQPPPPTPAYTHTAHLRRGASQKHFATSTAVPVWGLAPLVMAVLHCSVLPPTLLTEGTLDVYYQWHNASV
jgi:hypothetical protein